MITMYVRSGNRRSDPPREIAFSAPSAIRGNGRTGVEADVVETERELEDAESSVETEEDGSFRGRRSSGI